MKCLLNSLIVLIIFIATSSIAENQIYSNQPVLGGGWFGFAAGGKYEAFSLLFGLRGHNFGGDITVAFDSDTDDNLQDYPVPHSDYKIIEKDATHKNSVGFNIYYFISLKQHHSILLGTGYYIKRYCDIARSNVTNWKYIQNSKSHNDIPISIGYQYMKKKRLIGFSYNTITGITFQIGFAKN